MAVSSSVVPIPRRRSEITTNIRPTVTQPSKASELRYSHHRALINASA